MSRKYIQTPFLNNMMFTLMARVSWTRRLKWLQTNHKIPAKVLDSCDFVSNSSF